MAVLSKAHHHPSRNACLILAHEIISPSVKLICTSLLVQSHSCIKTCGSQLHKLPFPLQQFSPRESFYNQFYLPVGYLASHEIKMAIPPIILKELNEIGAEDATYYLSSTERRVDIEVTPKSTNLWQDVLKIFLPTGFPYSVSPDYINYQIYDSIQAFSSSIAGLLANRAVLEGIGVGDDSASPTAAIYLSILQESMGRLATIMFAHKLGTSLEPECKMWRLAADVLNDSAMILDALSPTFPKPVRAPLLGLSSVGRALCGVAAGSSKATLSSHFAKWDNIGELNAVCH